MNVIEVVEEFQARARTARTYREISALLLVVTIIGFTLYGLNQTRLGSWSGAALVAAVVLAAATLALAALSFIKLRCPNCDRALGEVPNAAFCPGCGAALRSDSVIGREIVITRARGSGGKAVAYRPAGARTAVKRWEPGGVKTGLDDYPGEAYPKNIRMFTTPDEMELTKRYIQLIDSDNSGDPKPETGKKIGSSAKPGRQLPRNKPAAEETGKAEVRRQRGFLGFSSVESLIAVIAGLVILVCIVIALVNSLRG
jgi:hypothetical protein